jgi:hypothetical protein
MAMRRVGAGGFRRIALILVLFALLSPSLASLGDRLPDFRDCVKVQAHPIPALTGFLTAAGLCRGKL